MRMSTLTTRLSGSGGLAVVTRELVFRSCEGAGLGGAGLDGGLSGGLDSGLGGAGLGGGLCGGLGGGLGGKRS